MIYFSRYCFFVFAIILFIIESILVIKGDVGGDFWEHASAIKELSLHPFNPSNPVLNIDIPHAFFSPYSLMVATVSRITGLNPVLTLQYVFSFINLVLFIAGFYFFCKQVFKENTQLVAATGLLFILFFWGKDPFTWSGFYHIIVLTAVLSYPSTFAMSLSFFVLGMVAKNPFDKYASSKNLLTILLITIVLLSHPTTGIQLFIGIAALYFTISNFSLKQTLLRSLFLIVPALLLSFCWPYFNTISLLFDNNEEFQTASLLMYKAILSKNWPFFVLLPGVLLFYRNNKQLVISNGQKTNNCQLSIACRFLSIYITTLIIVYIAGYFSSHYIIGRLISGIMLFSQLLIACIIVTAIKNKYANAVLYSSFVALTFMISLYRNRMFAERFFTFPAMKTYDRFSFLEKFVLENEVVMADQGTSRIVSAFAGKVITSTTPMYHVFDLPQRRKDVNDFFDKGVSDSIRQSILNKYHVRFILLNHKQDTLSNSTLMWMRSAGTLLYNKDSLELISIK